MSRTERSNGSDSSQVTPGRRQFIAVAATGVAVAALPTALGTAAYASPASGTDAAPRAATGGVKPFPLDAVALLPGVFRDNQARNTAYLHFVDIDRLLHTFRKNVGLPSDAEPCGGWEGPDVELRGHSTGHLLSGLALTYANTGDTAVRDKGRKLVAALAKCQEASPKAGFGKGYLSAFPESFFDRLEAGSGVWAPYYTIHKIMAGLVDQHRLAGGRAGPRRGAAAGRLGGQADRGAEPRPDAAGAPDRVRRHERRVRRPARDHR